MIEPKEWTKECTIKSNYFLLCLHDYGILQQEWERKMVSKNET